MVAWNENNGAAVVVGGRRTPFARMGTSLAAVPAADLAKRAIQETFYDCNCRPDRVDEVIVGNVVMPADTANPARVAALWAGVPNSVPALTVQRNCASGMESIGEAAMRIAQGRDRIAVAGGTESMSRVPLLFPFEGHEAMTRLARSRNAWQRMRALARLRPRHFRPVPALEQGLTDPTCGLIMGKTAEVLAHEFGVTRKEQDLFALESHRRATAAARDGKLAEEIVPVYVGGRFEAVTSDNGPRPQQNMEALGGLRPLFDRRDGTVTAGNSCQVTDGAAAMLVADAVEARAQGWDVLGRIRGYANVGLDPARMGLGPVFAVEALLRQQRMNLRDIELFEINEAFAAQVLACLKAMASVAFSRQWLNRDEALGEIDPDRLNVNGGAIALGHPVGATGTRLVLTLLLEMRRRNARFGIAALCVGGGQGAAMLLERS